MESPSRRQEFEDQALVHLDRVFHLALRLRRNRALLECAETVWRLVGYRRPPGAS